MLSKVLSYSILGINAYSVDIEVDISKGLPAVTIVGLPDITVKESKDRIRAAIKNSGLRFPVKRITVNLAPADVKKEGPSFDLPIAIGILAASGQALTEKLKNYQIIGELSLNGEIKPVKGVISIATYLQRKHKDNLKLIIPRANLKEAGLVNNIEVYGVSHLNEVVSFLNDQISLKSYKIDIAKFFNNNQEYQLDFKDIKGQFHAKRAIEVASAGAHNILLIGPPGAGKTMLAKRIPSILPKVSLEEATETTRIHSVAGKLRDDSPFINTRPYRAPHHTISDVGLIGGGTIPKPGEVTLAHNGVLFLDELPEFSRKSLEALRQPLESKEVVIVRASGSVTFPCNFMLVCAMNPCPCGYLTDPRKECHCTPQKVEKYLSKISGPLLDRIDIHIEVSPVKTHYLHDESNNSESSKDIRKRAEKALNIQSERFSAKGGCTPLGGKDEGIFFNGQMQRKHIKRYCKIDENSKDLLTSAINQLGLSARAYDKILKVSRTIADLDDSEKILPQHLSEAVGYRSLDRNLFG